MENRVYNFGAGPAMLPESVLKAAQAELLSWQGTGMSVLEIGHRTAEFKALLSQAQSALRNLLSIPNHYHVLFLGGAARTQFAMIPMNLLSANERGAYLLSGIWSQAALTEAENLKNAYCLASSKQQERFTTVPPADSWEIKKDTAYIYYAPNETIDGTRFPYVPKVDEIPLIADMTSCLLSEPINIEQYGLIFAGAQKNIANAGLTIVIIREDLVEKIAEPSIPSMLRYKIHAQHHSLYATPPVFNCYLAAKMFDWIKEQGGVEVLFTQNCLKAQTLYQYLDSTKFYTTSVAKKSRSLMNICFNLQNPTLEDLFLSEAKSCGLTALKGHRFVGGLRASLYNAMPMSGVEALIDFMSLFARKYSA